MEKTNIARERWAQLKPIQHSIGSAEEFLASRNEYERLCYEQMSTSKDPDNRTWNTRRLSLEGLACSQILELAQHGKKAVLDGGQKRIIGSMISKAVKMSDDVNDGDIDDALVLGIVNYLQTLQMSQLANTAPKSPVDSLVQGGRSVAMNVFQSGQK